MKLLLPSALLLCVSLISGCGTLFPKRVEFFQDKVKTFPEPREKEKEIQRQTAARAAEVSLETLISAVGENASTNVTAPAKDAAVLSGAVARSLGPPEKKSEDKADVLAARLDASIAKLNSRLDDFKKDVNENAGKKIEGTGLFSVPYFVWIGLVLVMVFIGFIILAVLWSVFKIYATSNPPLQIGVSAVQAGAGFLKKAVSEIAKGGEAFKQRLETEVNDPAVTKKVLELFRIEHERKQSAEVQSLVKALTRGE